MTNCFAFNDYSVDLDTIIIRLFFCVCFWRKWKHV